MPGLGDTIRYHHWRLPAGRALPRAGIGLLLALLLAACGRPAPTPEPVTITFAFLETDAAHYEALAGAFSRSHPGIRIELRPLRGEELEGLGPAEADVLLTPLPLAKRIERGDVLSLDPWLGADASLAADFFPGTLALYTRNGRTWGIPAGMDLLVMYYNNDLFDQRGIAYPRVGWTWEEFLAAAMALGDPAAGTYGYAPMPGMLDPFLFICEHGGRVVDDWQSPTRATLDDPRTVEALEWYADLFFRHGVVPAPQEAGQAFRGRDETYLKWILAGKVGLWMDVYASVESWTAPREGRLRWGVTTLPRDRQSATVAFTRALAVSSAAREPQACWQWAVFVTEQVPVGLAPARQSVARSAAYERQVGAEAAAVFRASAESAILVPPELVAVTAKTLEALGQAIQDILSGEVAPRDALSRAQQQAQEQAASPGQ